MLFLSSFAFAQEVFNTQVNVTFINWTHLKLISEESFKLIETSNITNSTFPFVIYRNSSMQSSFDNLTKSYYNLSLSYSELLLRNYTYIYNSTINYTYYVYQINNTNFTLEDLDCEKRIYNITMNNCEDTNIDYLANYTNCYFTLNDVEAQLATCQTEKESIQQSNTCPEQLSICKSNLGDFTRNGVCNEILNECEAQLDEKNEEAPYSTIFWTAVISIALTWLILSNMYKEKKHGSDEPTDDTEEMEDF